ncbi:hypothetical protein DYB36_012296, partial [Aphanomyces astaci]
GLATPVTTQERAELYGGVAYLLLTLCGTVWCDLTWQNQLLVGITETVENALGFGSAIKSLPVVYGTWTSLILFWNFLNNMYTCYYFNASLIRGSDNHFDMIGLPSKTRMGCKTPTATTSTSPPPAPLLALVTDFHTALFGQAWVNPAVNVVGLYNAPTSFCGSQSQFIIIATNQALVFALFASGAIDIYSICALQASDGCDAALIQAKAFVDALGPLLPSPVVVADVVGQLPVIHFFPYAQNTSSNDWITL